MDHATMIAAVAVLLTAIAALLREIRALASKALGAAATSDLILHRKLKRQQSGTLSTPATCAIGRTVGRVSKSG